jgi:hypothetical protein
MNMHNSRRETAGVAANKKLEEGRQREQLAIVDRYGRTRAASKRHAATESKNQLCLKEPNEVK